MDCASTTFKTTGFALWLAAFSLAVAPLYAIAQDGVGQKIPELYLNTDKGQCVAGCIENNEANVCDIICQCTIDKFREDMDLAAYRRLKGQMESGNLTPETRIYLDGVGQYCSEELEKALSEANGET